MSEPTYTYSPARNIDVSSYLKEVAGQIKSELDNMDTELHTNLKNWESPESKVQYQAKQTRWNNAAASMPAAADIAGETLRSITESMNRTDAGIAQSWS
ncbi:MAG: hypothetical protein QOF58_6398 [Pseudonocardiales bacterium]|jgi:uncharacterized protein YukE|nr:hypothetical protein [Pseudonocardiales bacterium]